MSRTFGRVLAATALSASFIGMTAVPASAQRVCFDIVVVIQGTPVTVRQCVPA